MKLEQNLNIKRCPYCGVDKPLMAAQWGNQTTNHSGKNLRWWKVYQCQNCGGLLVATALADGSFITEYHPGSQMETFEFEHLTGDVKDDFEEALKCYSFNCFNAFASMCRRTVQSIAENLGAKGKDKVIKQINDLKGMIDIDDETFNTLEQIIIAGHDGTHPHLPKLSAERAAVLLELMKDVIYQLYVRKKKIEKAVELRKEAIEKSKNN